MKSRMLVSLACAAMALVVFAELVQARHSNWQEWQAYKRKYGKSYATPEEDAQRFALYLRSKARLAMLEGAGGHKRGINHLSDWTEEELKQLNGLKFPEGELAAAHLANSEYGQKFLDAILEDDAPVPAALDWRKVPGRVSAVKDQKKCGSCWAFATTGVLEGQELVRNKSSMATLSEQDLIDCSTENNGCYGGLPTWALHDIAKMGGIESEQEYPYVGNPIDDEPCRFKKAESAFSTRGSGTLAQDEEIVKQFVAKYGPVSVGIHAGADLIDYQSGIYDNEDCPDTRDELNHAVLIVGYDNDPERGDHWIVKNSWNESWGEKGYFRIARGKNTCGISLFPVIATF